MSPQLQQVLDQQTTTGTAVDLQAFEKAVVAEAKADFAIDACKEIKKMMREHGVMVTSQHGESRTRDADMAADIKSIATSVDSISDRVVTLETTSDSRWTKLVVGIISMCGIGFLALIGWGVAYLLK